MSAQNLDQQEDIVQKKIGNFIVLFSPNYQLGKGPLGIVFKAIQEVSKEQSGNKSNNCLSKDYKPILLQYKGGSGGHPQMNLCAGKRIDIHNIFEENPFYQSKQTNYKLSKKIESFQKLPSHANIAKFYGINQTSTSIYVFFEYVKSGNLIQYLKSTPQQKFEERQAIFIFKKLFYACKFLGDNNIINRNIKPENIILDQFQEPKFIDYGLYDWFEKYMKQDVRENFRFSPYQSPEVLMDTDCKQIYTDSADLWSLGVILYEMLFGYQKYPFKAKNSQELLEKQIHYLKDKKLILPKNDLSSEVCDLLQQLLQFNPNDRKWKVITKHPLLKIKETKKIISLVENEQQLNSKGNGFQQMEGKGKKKIFTISCMINNEGEQQYICFICKKQMNESENQQKSDEQKEQHMMICEECFQKPNLEYQDNVKQQQSDIIIEDQEKSLAQQLYGSTIKVDASHKNQVDGQHPNDIIKQNAKEKQQEAKMLYITLILYITPKLHEEICIIMDKLKHEMVRQNIHTKSPYKGTIGDKKSMNYETVIQKPTHKRIASLDTIDDLDNSIDELLLKVNEFQSQKEFAKQQQKEKGRQKRPSLNLKIRTFETVKSLHHKNNNNNIKKIQKDQIQNQQEEELQAEGSVLNSQSPFGMAGDVKVQTVQNLGRGGAGEVKLIYNYELKQFYAVKSFNYPGYYDQEKEKYCQLLPIADDLNGYGIMMERYDDAQQQIHFKTGYCNLAEFAKIRQLKRKQSKKYMWTHYELMYLFRRLVKLAFKMYDNGFYHGDIKPDNVVLEPKSLEKNIYEIKVIDFAGTSKAQNECMLMQLTHDNFTHIKHPHIEIHKEKFGISKIQTDGNQCLKLIQYGYDFKQIRKYQWKVHVLSLPKHRTVAIGICNQEFVSIELNLKQKQKYAKGSFYLVNQIGQQLHSDNNQQAIQQQFQFQQGDVLEISFNVMKKTLELCNIVSKQRLDIPNIRCQDDDTLRPCFAFSDSDSWLQIYGCMVYFPLFQDMYTPQFFFHYLRENRPTVMRAPIFMNAEERFKNEIYTIIRTFQYICLLSDENEEANHHFAEKQCSKRGQSYQGLMRIMERIRQQIFPKFFNPDTHSDFIEFFEYIETKLITEEYEVQELRQFINDYNSDVFKFPEVEKGLLDQDELIKDHIQKKILQYQLAFKKDKSDNEHPIEKIFQQETYIRGSRCSYHDGGDAKTFDLFQQTQEFILNKDQQIFIVFGDSGTGKSSFLCYLFERIQDENNSNMIDRIQQPFETPYKAYLIKCSTIKNLKELKKEIKKKMEQIEKIQSFLFLLDGFDELRQHLQMDFMINDLFYLNKNKRNKIIITSRKESLSSCKQNRVIVFEQNNNSSQVRNKRIKRMYISQFTQEQRGELIRAFVKNIDFSMILNFPVYNKEEIYLKKFKQNTELKQLAENPLICRIILQLIPAIEKDLKKIFEQHGKTKQIELLRKKHYSQYFIYQKFLRIWGNLKAGNLENNQSQALNSIQVVLEHCEYGFNRTPIVQKKTPTNKNGGGGGGGGEESDEWEQDQPKTQEERVISEFNTQLAFILWKNDQVISTELSDIILREIDISENEKYSYKEKALAVLMCSPIKFEDNNTQYYTHMSFYEFYLANFFINELKYLENQLKGEYNFISYGLIKNLGLNQKLIKIQDLQMIRFIQSRYKYAEKRELQFLKNNILLKIIYLSRNYNKSPLERKKIEIISANAATIFNALNFSFSNLDLSETILDGALLQQAFMHKVNLSYAILDNVNLEGAILEEANLTGASMHNVTFTQRNTIFAGFQKIKCIQFSPDCRSMAIAGSPKDSVEPIKCAECNGNLREVLDPYRDQNYGFNCELCEKHFGFGNYSMHCGCLNMGNKQQIRENVNNNVNSNSSGNQLNIDERAKVGFDVCKACYQQNLTTHGNDYIKMWNLDSIQTGGELIRYVQIYFEHKKRNLHQNFWQIFVERILRYELVEIKFSKNGRHLVGVYTIYHILRKKYQGEYFIVFWDLERKGLMVRATNQMSGVNCIALSQEEKSDNQDAPDSRYIAIGMQTGLRIMHTTNKGIQITELIKSNDTFFLSKSEKEKMEMQNRKSGVLCVQFSKLEVTRLATGHSDGSLKIWEIKENFLNEKFDSTNPISLTQLKFVSLLNQIIGVSFSPKEPLLSIAIENNPLQIWKYNVDPQPKPLVEDQSEKHKAISSTNIVFSQDGESIFGGQGQQVRRWSILNGSVQNIMKGHEEFIYKIAVSQDDKFIASIEEPCKILHNNQNNSAFILKQPQLWIRSQNSHQQQRTEFANKRTPSQKQLPEDNEKGKSNNNSNKSTGNSISHNQKPQQQMWKQLNIGKSLKYFNSDLVLQDIVSVTFSQDSQHVIGTTWYNDMYSWNIYNGEIQLIQKGGCKTSQFPRQPHGNIKAEYDEKAYSKLKYCEMENYYFNDANYLKDLFQINIKQQKIAFKLKLGEEKVLYHLKLHTSQVESITFSPDSRFMVSLDESKQIYVWKIEENTQKGNMLNIYLVRIISNDQYNFSCRIINYDKVQGLSPFNLSYLNEKCFSKDNIYQLFAINKIEKQK